MIGKLSGVVDAIDGERVLIDVNGVGYIAHCSARTLAQLPAPGGRATLIIETQMTQEQIKLFGFGAAQERDWFQLLQSVQGVGAKVALAILGALAPAELAQAIAKGDKAQVARAQGVGPKLAQRITNELKDKVPAGLVFAGPAIAPKSGRPDGAAAEAVSALVNLGYAPQQASEAVARALDGDPNARVETLIRAGLKELSR
ncbi:MAG TPA: Holliday junction branch migration protein RuvA [Alphaproteobacteria bacterium]|nr:Holliday junction branch migration protein RuvA [Alphaproteobacteria bacterium]